MRIYIGGGSHERLEVRALIDTVRAHGVDVTLDWTRCEGYDRPSAPAERRAWARRDLDAVRAADVVWIVAPDGKSEGAAVEMGAALALRKRVIISGPHARRADRIFGLLAEVHDTHAAALEEVFTLHALALVRMCP